MSAASKAKSVQRPKLTVDSLMPAELAIDEDVEQEIIFATSDRHDGRLGIQTRQAEGRLIMVLASDVRRT